MITKGYVPYAQRKKIKTEPNYVTLEMVLDVAPRIADRLERYFDRMESRERYLIYAFKLMLYCKHSPYYYLTCEKYDLMVEYARTKYDIDDPILDKVRI